MTLTNGRKKMTLTKMMTVMKKILIRVPATCCFFPAKLKSFLQMMN
jgi:hypothetical protein